MIDRQECGQDTPYLNRLGYTFRLVSREEMHLCMKDNFNGLLTYDYSHQFNLTSINSPVILLNRDEIDSQFLEFYAEHEARELWIRKEDQVSHNLQAKAKEFGLALVDDAYDKNRSLYHHIAVYYTAILAHKKGMLNDFAI